MKDKDLDFELSFYEGILKKNPNFVQVLFILGDLYTKKGWYKKSLEIDKRLARLRPQDEIVYYNLACDYSLLKNIDASLKALRKALKLGFQDFHLMEKDPDLDYVRQDKRFQELILEFKKGKLRKFKSLKKLKTKGYRSR
ncbi:MAG: hypothetical protein NC909_00265 [Candidatus Omnitrophica bacterium]|nr:hypothetical protein [Candidatus Omnitrophota bacterium]